MSLPRKPVYEPGRTARGTLWDAPAGSDGAEVLEALRAIFEADNEAGVVPGWSDIPRLLLQARGFDPDLVRRGVQHVELMIALGRPFHRSGGATFWAGVSAGPNSTWRWHVLHERVVPSATRAVFLEQLEAHVLRPPAPPSSGETRPRSAAPSHVLGLQVAVDESARPTPGTRPPPVPTPRPAPPATPIATDQRRREAIARVLAELAPEVLARLAGRARADTQVARDTLRARSRLPESVLEGRIEALVGDRVRELLALEHAPAIAAALARSSP